MLVHDAVWVPPLVYWFICINNMNIKYTHNIGFPEANESRIPINIRAQLVVFSLSIPPCEPSQIHLPPVGSTSPDAATQYVLSLLLSAAGV